MKPSFLDIIRTPDNVKIQTENSPFRFEEKGTANDTRADVKFTAEDGILKGGTIYEPESGKTCYAKISYNEADNTITLRGSLDRRGWVGRSQTWIKERK